MVDVLAFLRRTIESGASPQSVLSHSDYQQLTSAAVAGDAAMFLGGNWQLGDLEAGLPPAEFAKWDVAPIPQKAAGTSSTGTGGWVWVMFARDPVRQRAAAEFLQFVESPRNVGRITSATGHLPVRKSVFRDVPFFRDSPWHQKFSEMVVHGKARPAASAYPLISAQLQLAIGAAVSRGQDAGAGGGRRLEGGAGGDVAARGTGRRRGRGPASRGCPRSPRSPSR